MKNLLQLCKVNIQTAAWLLLLCFFTQSSYQSFQCDEQVGSVEGLVEYSFEVDEVENFSDYRSAEIHSISAVPNGHLTIAFVCFTHFVNSSRSSFLASHHFALKQPIRIAMLGVFRI